VRLFPGRVEFLFVDATDVRDVLARHCCCAAGGCVAAFVQTQVLRLLLAGFGPVDHDRVDLLLQSFGVMHVRARGSSFVMMDWMMFHNSSLTSEMVGSGL
jgi:hypothetical protein